MTRRETAIQSVDLQHRAANPQGNPFPHDPQLVMQWLLVDELLFNDKVSFLDLIAAGTSSNDSFRFKKKRSASDVHFLEPTLAAWVTLFGFGDEGINRGKDV